MLWKTDALHRANNLAQMSASLLSTRTQQAYGLSFNDTGTMIRALARAYAELGAGAVTQNPVPCRPLLEAIVSRLILLFSADRTIVLELSAEDIFLAPDRRRALLLIASELVINALKYAFSYSHEGVIMIGFTERGGIVELSVSDNGSGLASHSIPGSGSMLMQKLAAFLGAEVRYTSTTKGLSIDILMPIA